MNRQIVNKEDTMIYSNTLSVKSNDFAKNKRNDSVQTSHISGRLGHESMKDSGIGATYLATSSGSTSENTSPESEKDAQIPNGKAPKALSSSTIGAASTPATTIKKYKHVDATSQLKSKSVRKKIISCGDLTFDEDSKIQQLGTPLASRSKTIIKYGDLDKPCATRPNHKNLTANKEVIAKLIENFNEACQTPGRRRQRRMHACEFCDKQFDRPSLLKRHNLTHTGERPFECRFCSKGFSTRSGVNTHERTHTGQRPYVCRICGRRFAAGSNLIFHKYTHTNTRRHVCTHCPKAFVTPGDLRKHEYTHTGEWPFRCHLCDRGFATERNLRSHEITHTGQKPHICQICGKGYAQESSMKTHIRSHLKSNVTKSDKTIVSNLGPAQKEAQTSCKTPIIQNNATSQSAWQPSDVYGVYPTPHYLSNTNQSAYNIQGYSVSSDSSTGGLVHPSSVDYQHRSAFSVPHSNEILNRNAIQNPMATGLNPTELQSLLYDRYRVYYELYMKALNNPHDNHVAAPTWNPNFPSKDSPAITPTSIFSYSPYEHLENMQPMNISQNSLPNQPFQHLTSRSIPPSVLTQTRSTSICPSTQQTSTMNLTFRSTVPQTLQIQSTSQPRNTTIDDFDLQPLDYSIRGLSSYGKK